TLLIHCACRVVFPKTLDLFARLVQFAIVSVSAEALDGLGEAACMRDVGIAHTPSLVEPIAEVLPRDELGARHAPSPRHSRHRQKRGRLAVARSIDTECAR